MPDFTERLTPEERVMFDELDERVEILRARVDTVEVNYATRIDRTQNDTVSPWSSEMDRLKQYIVNDLPEVIVEWFSRYFDPSITEESTKEMRDSLRELLSSGFPS